MHANVISPGNNVGRLTLYYGDDVPTVLYVRHLNPWVMRNQLTDVTNAGVSFGVVCLVSGPGGGGCDG